MLAAARGRACLMDIFWTTLMVVVFVLGIWLLFVASGTSSMRADLPTGERGSPGRCSCSSSRSTGSLIYLAKRSGRAPGELRDGRVLVGAQDRQIFH